MGKGLELKFLRWYTNDQEAYEKTVNSASYQGKKKIKPQWILPHTLQDGYYLKDQKQNKNCTNKCWQGCGEIESLYTVGGITKLVQLLWKVGRCSSKT